MKDEIAEKAARECAGKLPSKNLIYADDRVIKIILPIIAEACRQRAIDELNNLLNVKRQTHYEKCNEVVIKAIDRLSALTPKEMKD